MLDEREGKISFLLSGPAKKQSHLLKNNCFQGFTLDANSNAGLFGSGASFENRKCATENHLKRCLLCDDSLICERATY